MKNLIILLITIFCVFAILIIEFIKNTKKRNKIPIRVHVNGTRGKSSVTRLIAAGLRAGHVKTCAKTTGTLPQMIMPNGVEFPVFRPGSTNIGEQIRIIDVASTHNVKALVIECMALQPYLQWVSEYKMIRATHAVITNIKADHLEIMGPDENGVALALCGMIPINGKLYTCEVVHKEILQKVAKDRNCEVIFISAEDSEKITPRQLSHFQYIEHPDNIALALKICEDLGVDRNTALKGMYTATPDSGALVNFEINFFGRSLYFFNGFAANDPDSTEQVWNIAIEKYPEVKTRIALFNCRADRPDRSIQLGKACVHWQNADYIVLMGTGTYLFSKAAIGEGVEYTKIHYADDLSIEEIFELLVGLSGPSSIIVGMGNIGGQGLDMVQQFRNRAVLKEAV